MATDEQAFNALLDSIKDGSYKNSSIELESKGLTDQDVVRLISAINSNPGFARKLTTLDLNDNLISVAPDVSKLLNLEFIFLQNNQITIPPDVSKCDKLMGLGFSNNPYTALSNSCVKALARQRLDIGISRDTTFGNDLNMESLEEHISNLFYIYWQQHSGVLQTEDIAHTVQGWIQQDGLTIEQISDKIIAEYLLKNVGLDNLYSYIYKNLDSALAILLRKEKFESDVRCIIEGKKNLETILRKVMQVSIEPIFFEVADAYLYAEKTTEAKKYYSLLAEAPYNNSEALFMMGKILEAQKDFPAAKIMYLRSAKLGFEPANAKILDLVAHMPNISREIINIIKCGITLEVMLNPVTAITGRSFEAENIKKWLKESSSKTKPQDRYLDPIDRQPLDFPAGSGEVSLVPNKTLAGLIEHILLTDGDIASYPALKHDGDFFVDPYLDLDGNTVEKNDADETSRRDLVLKNLIEYLKHSSVTHDIKSQLKKTLD